MSSSYTLLRQSLLRNAARPYRPRSMRTQAAARPLLLVPAGTAATEQRPLQNQRFMNTRAFSSHRKNARMRDENLTARNLAADKEWWQPHAPLRTVVSSTTEWMQNAAVHWSNKLPQGFQDFFPESGKAKPPVPGAKPIEDASATTSPDGNGTTKKSDSPDAAKLSAEQGTGSDNKKQEKKGNGVPPPEDTNMNGVILLLGLILLVQKYTEQEEQGMGKEITFVEFRNSFLDSGKVEKLEIINKSRARVVLHPDATMSSSTSGGGGGSVGSDTHDGTTMDFEETASSNGSRAGGAGSAGSSQAGGAAATQQQQHFYFNIGSIESLEEKLTKAQQHIHPSEWIEVQYVEKTNLAVEFLKNLPLLAFVAAVYFGSRGMAGMAGGAGGGGGMGGVFGVGKTNAKKIKPEEVGVSFKDVAGCQQAKAEIVEFVDFLKDASRFTKLGAKIPKGALLCGPPGTGKTLLAKAIAGEAGVPFYSTSGSEFIEMFVGVGTSRVRDLFKEARANAPCIIFIDEIDAVGRQRGRGGFSGGNDERENTLNQLLVEMDGFSPSTGVVVLAGTNRADILDPALTRPGRFDRTIQIDRPDLAGRKEIFEVHLQGLTLESSIEEYAGRLAGLTPGFAGADIANICNEAAIVAARRKADSVSISDFDKATDRIIGGLESNKIMSKEELSIVAHHEAGHAVAGWFLEHADPLLKVTIIPRTSGALGFAQYLPKETFLRSEEQIQDIVCMALAGRAAEEVFFGGVTTGASDDLRRVTQLVYSTIQVYGMNEKVGQLAFPKNEDAGPGERRYSDSTAEAMDDEARRLVDAAYERTLKLIRKRKTDVEKVANLLLAKETITHDDMIDTIGDRPFPGDTAYQEYVSNRVRKDEKTKDPMEEEKEEEETPLVGGLTPGLV